VFHWTLGHHQEIVANHLQSFSGTFVGDAFGGNVRLNKFNPNIQFAACNTHARREFLKAEITAPLESVEALAFYSKLSDIEKRGKKLSPEARKKLRQQEAAPLWDRFRKWLDGIPIEKQLPKSALGKAITYVNNQWEGLTRYLTDGRIPIDNSQSEQEIRPLTIGRKNWLFFGHPDAAASRLRLFSIVSSAARHELKLEMYLESVLRELSWAAQKRPSELELDSELLLRCLPDRWAEAHPDGIRKERREEKADREERATYLRARRRLDRRKAKQAENPA
jgi:transposase